MLWNEVNDQYSISDCGLYSVCLVRLPIDGVLTSTWEAWTVGHRTRVAEQLAVRLKFQHQAKEICESHAAMTHRVSTQTPAEPARG